MKNMGFVNLKNKKARKLFFKNLYMVYFDDRVYSKLIPNWKIEGKKRFISQCIGYSPYPAKRALIAKIILTLDKYYPSKHFKQYNHYEVANYLIENWEKRIEKTMYKKRDKRLSKPLYSLKIAKKTTPNDCMELHTEHLARGFEHWDEDKQLSLKKGYYIRDSVFDLFWPKRFKKEKRANKWVRRLALPHNLIVVKTGE